MTIPRVDPQLKSIPVIAVTSAADRSGSELREHLRTIAELADPMQSVTVKGWLKGDLRTPN